jgi:hypothetical protein
LIFQIKYFNKNLEFHSFNTPAKDLTQKINKYHILTNDKS